MRKFFDISTYQGFLNHMAFGHQTYTIKSSEAEMNVNENCMYWNAEYKAMHVNDTGDTLRGGFTIPLGRFEVGDKVKIKAEFLVLSGDFPGVYFDIGGGQMLGAKNLATKYNEWEEVTLELENYNFDYNTYLGRGDAYVGGTTATKTNYYIRNVQVETIQNNDYVDRAIPFDFKNIQLRITGSDAFENLTHTNPNTLETFFSMDNCTFTVSKTGLNQDCLKVRYDKPFTCPRFRGLVIAQVTGDVPTTLEVRCMQQTYEGFNLVFFNTNTNTVWNPRELYPTFGTVYVQIFCIGGTGYY